MFRKTGLGVCALVALAIGGCPPPAETTDTGPVSGDAGTDARVGRDTGPAGDPFAAFRTALTEEATAVCTCIWMDNGFKNIDACVSDRLMNVYRVQCDEVGYNAARTMSAASYRCQAPAFSQFATCRTAAGCATGAAGDAARMACRDTIQAALMSCPDLPAAATDAARMCIIDMFLGPAGTCPASGAPWMGTGTFMTTTLLAGDDENPFNDTCFPGAMTVPGLEISADVAHRWVAPAPGRYTISTMGTDFDTILSVKNACSDMLPFVCNDDIDTMGGNVASSVVVEATSAGQEFIVVIDGFTVEASGPVTVVVTSGGMVPDAGVMTDAGVDAGSTADAGRDAGVTVDGGSTADAGPDAPAPL